MAISQKKGIKQNPAFKIACILLAIIVVSFTLLTPPPEGLSQEGWTMLSIVVAAMILYKDEEADLIDAQG